MTFTHSFKQQIKILISLIPLLIGKDLTINTTLMINHAKTLIKLIPSWLSINYPSSLIINLWRITNLETGKGVSPMQLLIRNKSHKSYQKKI